MKIGEVVFPRARGIRQSTTSKMALGSYVSLMKCNEILLKSSNDIPLHLSKIYDVMTIDETLTINVDIYNIFN